MSTERWFSPARGEWVTVHRERPRTRHWAVRAELGGGRAMTFGVEAPDEDSALEQAKIQISGVTFIALGVTEIPPPPRGKRRRRRPGS